MGQNQMVIAVGIVGQWAVREGSDIVEARGVKHGVPRGGGEQRACGAGIIVSESPPSVG